MHVFVLQFLPVFRGAEVPGFRPEIPAPGSSGPSTGSSGPYFHLSFLAKSFRRFSLEGFRNFAPKVSSEISVVRKFRFLVRNIRPKENLAKSFAFFSRVGVRNFAPEVCSGIFRGTRSSGVSTVSSAPRPEVPVLNPRISGPALLQRLVFGGGYK